MRYSVLGDNTGSCRVSVPSSTLLWVERGLRLAPSPRPVIWQAQDRHRLRITIGPICTGLGSAACDVQGLVY